MSEVARRVQEGRGSRGVVQGRRFRIGGIVRFVFLGIYVGFLLLRRAQGMDLNMVYDEIPEE
jgi:hypothetical protein